MSVLFITRIVAVVGILVGFTGIMLRLREIMNRPFKKDLSRERGSARRGVLFAFTLGMAPWEKESTRLHWIAYLRGIFFHIGIFAAFAVFVASPWLSLFPNFVQWIALPITAVGAAFGFAGIVMRLAGRNERALSLPDDYASVFLASLFIACACAALIWSEALPVFYLATGIVSAYIPLGKIRHCVYFFYSKFFFGMNFGRRGSIARRKSGYAE